MIEGMAQENGAEDGASVKGGASDTTAGDDNARHRVRLPRFIVHEPVGAGQVIKRLTSAVGVRPCDPCERRAARVDRWLRVEPRR
jgi:hypothetical protein